MRIPLPARIVSLVSFVVLAACETSPSDAERSHREPSSAMSAASGVTRADAGKSSDEYRVIPLREMSGQLPTGIDRALRLLIPLPVLIRNDQGESDGQA